ncbi:hypothetical protein ANANG_G00302860, partial [Anguilla anguilla]
VLRASQCSVSHFLPQPACASPGPAGRRAPNASSNGLPRHLRSAGPMEGGGAKGGESAEVHSPLREQLWSCRKRWRGGEEALPDRRERKRRGGGREREREKRERHHSERGRGQTQPWCLY